MNIKIKMTQQILNRWGITDDAGRTLKEDGLEGPKTNQAKAKAKAILNIILK